MVHFSPLVSIFSIGLGLSFLLGFIAAKLRLSPIIGYIITGIIIGPYTPGFEADATLAKDIAEIGVIFLMFGVGLHFSLKDLNKAKKLVIPGAILQASFAVFFGWLFTSMLGFETSHAIIFGLCISTASTVVLLKALESRNEISTLRGKFAISWLVVEDIIVIIVLVTLPVITLLINGSGGDTSLFYVLSLTFGKLIAFVIFMLLIGKKVIPWLLIKTASLGNSELFNISVIAIALGIAYGAAYLFDISFALGAFFAGMILNETELSHRAADSTISLRDMSAVLFFVSIGMIFDFKVIYQHPIAIFVTVFLIMGLRSVVIYFIVRLLGQSKTTSLAMGFGLAQIGELSFILSSLSVSLNFLTDLERSYILAGAIISIILNPVLYYILDKYENKQLAAATNDVVITKESIKPKDRESDISGKLNSKVQYLLTNHTIIVDYNPLNVILAKKLYQKNNNFIICTKDNEVADKLTEENKYNVLFGDDKDLDLYHHANIESASNIIFTALNPYEYADIIISIRKHYPNINIITFANYEDERKYFLDKGINTVIMGRHQIAINIIEHLHIENDLLTEDQNQEVNQEENNLNDSEVRIV